jgi:hypothetical protein
MWMGLGATASGLHAGPPLVFRSAVTPTRLLELYTSEGCSSCPPADAWLSALAEAPGLWKDFVPVSFHVDYWDQLGWPDALASGDFSARQRQYAARWNARTIYTPGFVLDGLDWRGWRGTGVPAPSAAPVGVLGVTPLHDGRFQVQFQPHGQTGEHDVFLALLGCGIQTEVARGENAGRRLKHDFAVLQLQQAPLQRGTSGMAATLRLHRAPEAPAAGRHALACWVTRRGDLTPIQATGGYLP